MKFAIPVTVRSAFAASVLSIAGPIVLAAVVPASALQAKEPVVNITATNATTGYGEAPGVFTITLSEKQDKPVTVLYKVQKSNPVNGVDYNRLSGVKVIKAGKTHASIRVVPTESSDGPFGSGPVELKLHKADGYKLGTDKEASVEITIVLP